MRIGTILMNVGLIVDSAYEIKQCKSRLNWAALAMGSLALVLNIICVILSKDSEKCSK